MLVRKGVVLGEKKLNENLETLHQPHAILSTTWFLS